MSLLRRLPKPIKKLSLWLKLILVFPTAWFLFVFLVGLQDKSAPGAAVPVNVPVRDARAGRGAMPDAPHDEVEMPPPAARTTTSPAPTVRPPHAPPVPPVAEEPPSVPQEVRPVQPEQAVLAMPHDENEPGAMGKAVTLSKNLTADVKKLVDDGWQNNAFNQYASDMISLHRSLPDMRDEPCKMQDIYNTKLPDTSVIICFHNEAWSVLLRTVHSVLDRSPPHLLNEIVLVDDASTLPHLLGELDEYVKKFPKVKVARAPSRVGLIRARLVGAAQAKGEVLTYLDSHCECTEGWLEPLLDRIARNWTTVVCPVIDVIDDNTLEYMHRDASGTNVGGFDWNLQFNWHAVPDRERQRRKYPSDPVWSPTMAGGLFSISRAYFEHLGTYDSGFDIWGGENLELSFKVWMCGGTLEIIPCSHVGHIFRKRSPYKWRTGVNVLKRNSIRLAEVWLDDYKQYYYQRIGNDLGDYGDVTSRKELRKNLNCHSFQWYLNNIYPELFVPGDALASGEVRNIGEGGATCLDSPNRKQDLHKPVTMYPCHKQGGNQLLNVASRADTVRLCLTGSFDEEEDDAEAAGKTNKNAVSVDVCAETHDEEQFWMLSRSGEIRRDDSCLDFAGSEVILYPCHGSKGNQHWFYNDKTRMLKHVNSKKCLEMMTDKVKLAMQPCDDNNMRQHWRFQEFKLPSTTKG